MFHPRAFPTAVLPLLLPAVFAVLAPAHLSAQRLDPGPQVLTYFSTLDDTDQPYAVYLPPDFGARDRYPLVISLHGAGSNHRLNLRRVFGESNRDGESDVEASRTFPEWDDVDYIVASPLARGTMGYRGAAAHDVMGVLEDVKRRFPVDTTRMFLTGLSMGGGGALWHGLTRPGLWAGIAAVCPAPPPGTERFSPNALHTPVHLFQGADDGVVDPASVRAWRDRLDSLGTDVEYTEYEGVGHASWVPAYADGQIFDWFDTVETVSHPDRVRFVTDRYRYDRSRWVRVDALSPGTTARIDARFENTNSLRVSVEGLDAFTLFLAGHPRVRTGRPMTVRVGNQRLGIQARDTLAFHRGVSGWRPGAERPADRPRHAAKQPGGEGPMAAALSQRHVYVYGTAGDPSDAELARRRERAVTAATWSVYRGEFLGRVKAFPRVVADRSVRQSDLETANLILFGTRETNRLIDRFSDRLPMQYTGAAGTTSGLVYIFPVGLQSVVVSSGRPWWEAPPPPGGGDPFGREVPALRLEHGRDYLYFETAGDSTRIGGRFTPRWQLPEAAGDSLEATGRVEVAPAGGSEP